jgi:hypothetical protein
MYRPFLIWAASVALSLPVVAQVQLITDAEAHLPDGKTTATRAITRGPGIRFESATEVQAKSFGFKVTIEPRGGANLDPKSLKVELMNRRNTRWVNMAAVIFKEWAISLNLLPIFSITGQTAKIYFKTFELR